MKRVSLFLFLSALLTLPAASSTSAPGALGVELGKPLTVMTRNLYVGADLFEVMQAERPEQVPLLVAKVFRTIVKNSILNRAQGLADEVARVQPDAIGLQEVSLIRLQSPGDFLRGNPQSAQIVIYDFLATLLLTLKERGLEYEIAASVENADIEMPMYAGGDQNGPKLDDVRLTDRDVLLVRKGLQYENVVAKNFQTNLKVPIGGVEINFTRGFVASTVTVRGRQYRIVNVHLETGGKPPFTLIQAAQMQELLAHLNSESLPTILLGDFNSAPTDPATQPYHQARSSGFVDLWDRAHPFSSGYTCCQDPELDNSSSKLSARIDHIFVRNNLNGALPFSLIGLARVERLGYQVTQEGLALWPSDHAGVAAQLKLPFIFQ